MTAQQPRPATKMEGKPVLPPPPPPKKPQRIVVEHRHVRWPGERSVPFVRWQLFVCDPPNEHRTEWRLLVGHGEEARHVATVWDNGVWSTWDRNGAGGENSSEPTVRQAKVEAAASAIEQGFI